ncbi:EamA-like transporter family protein [Candidatus Izimaplasma bacterium HR1]|jgi:drug/metabolite transporter (DMT)-like permease|uniref:DMT family transporter n=1 Tax=Candidatus Izimoplasma sp. HR1 TaxID=1541959 RepID=UPI0004F8F283|nr:EamA-like transporter family protein [Candidatus Izimaplasma bacterium HR1]
MSKKRTYSEIALIFTTVIWGLGFPITKLAINSGFGPNTIMVGRFFTASILLGLVYFKRLKKINKIYLVTGTITGLFLFFGFYFQTLGNVYTTASKNGFITQLNIVFVPYLYFLFFKKKVDFYNIIAVVVAVIGMFLMFYSKNEFNSFNIGDFYTIICAILVAFNIITGSFYQKKYDLDPAVFIFVNIIVSCVLSLLFMAVSETLPNVEILDYWPLLFLGVLNTGLGFLVQGYALKYSLPTRVSLIVTLESVVAAIGAVLIINEVLSLNIVIGGFMIVSAVIVSEIKPFNKLKQKT